MSDTLQSFEETLMGGDVANAPEDHLPEAERVHPRYKLKYVEGQGYAGYVLLYRDDNTNKTQVIRDARNGGQVFATARHAARNASHRIDWEAVEATRADTRTSADAASTARLKTQVTEDADGKRLYVRFPFSWAAVSKVRKAKKDGLKAKFDRKENAWVMPADQREQVDELVEVIDALAANPPAKRDVRQEVTDDFIARIEKGTAPWQQPFDAETAANLLMPVNGDRGYRYHGINRVMLMAGPYADNRWFTFKQAKDNGLKVPKKTSDPATHPKTIEYWNFIEKEVIRDKETGEPLLDEDGEKRYRELRNPKPFPRFSAVYNAEQLEGELPPAPTHEPVSWSLNEIAERAESGGAVTIHHDAHTRCYYDAVEDVIHMAPKRAFETEAGYCYALLHQLARWSGHEKRLARELGGSSITANGARESLRCEMAAMMLAVELGLPYQPDNADARVGKIVEVLERSKHEIFRAAKEAERACDFVRINALDIDETTRPKTAEDASEAPATPATGPSVAAL